MEMKKLNINGQVFDIRDETAVSYSQLSDALSCTEKTKNRVTAIDENADDEHYPTAKAVYDLMRRGVAAFRRYDLKSGYGYTPDVFIAQDGAETPVTGQNYKCVDYIPVKAGVPYTMFGVGYALYDEAKVFLSAVIDSENAIREFTPTENGFVRLTVNSEDLGYARFCRTSEKYYEVCDYEQEPNPFFNPRFPCDVHLYGDSNSEGYGLADGSKAWANRLGTCITSLKSTMYHTRFSGFGEKTADNNAIILKNCGYVRFTVYTDVLKLRGTEIGEIRVKIDGKEVTPMTTEVTDSYNLALGLHIVECFGVSGTNKLDCFIYKHNRSFTNHAVFGSDSGLLPEKPVGSIAIVMYGTNDRMITQGNFYRNIWRFYQACLENGVKPILFTPIPTAASGETGTQYKTSLSDIISMLPPDSINIYKDLQLVEILSGETLYGDNLHLTERGHKILYGIAASKLGLAALTSELEEE